MSDWKSCGNCLNDKGLCQRDLEWACIKKDFKLWEKIPCPFCGGTLSGLRRSNGHFIRHCYSCNFDFPIDKDGMPRRVNDEKEGKNV